MIKKLFIVFSILVIIGGITVFAVFNNQNKNTSFEMAKSNILTNSITNNIETKKTNEQVNEMSNEIVNEILEETNNLPESSENESTVIVSNNTAQPTTKEENKPITKTEAKTSVSSNDSSKASTPINTPAVIEQEDSPAQVDTTPVEEPIEETPQVEVSNARPELAYATYREVNTSVVPEIIRILNNEIQSQDDLVAYGCKALAGNAAEAKAKTNGFTYMFVKDIHKGKVAGNYTIFEQRVRNNVGGFANYNVYAEDEYTYDGQGLNPKWSQTLVWIYLTF